MSNLNSFLINREIDVKEVLKNIYELNEEEGYNYLKTQIYKSEKDRHSYYAINSLFLLESSLRESNDRRETTSYLNIDQIILKLQDIVDNKEYNENDRVIRNIYKLLDHIKLEKIHIDNSRRIKISYEREVNKHKEELKEINELYKKEVECAKKEIDEKSKSLHKEVIGLLGIFTALAFISFGGISILDNFFDGIGQEGIRLRQLMLVGSITAISIVSLVYIFIYGVMEITSIGSNKQKEFLKKVYNNTMIVLIGAILVSVFTYIYEYEEISNYLVSKSINRKITNIIYFTLWIFITITTFLVIERYKTSFNKEIKVITKKEINLFSVNCRNKCREENCKSKAS